MARHFSMACNQERSAEVEAIRAALIEGETSGEPRLFDASTFKQRMAATRRL